MNIYSVIDDTHPFGVSKAGEARFADHCRQIVLVVDDLVDAERRLAVAVKQSFRL